MRRPVVTAVLGLALMLAARSASAQRWSPYDVTAVTAVPLDAVPLPSGTGDDEPNVWTMTPPPQGQRYLQVTFTITVNWADKSAPPVRIERGDVVFGPDPKAVEVVGTFSRYAAVSKVGSPSDVLAMVYRPDDPKREQSVFNTQVLALAPAELKRFTVGIGDKKFEVVAADHPAALDVKTRFTFRVTRATLVPSVQAADGAPLANPRGKVLLVDFGMKMPRTNDVSGLEGPTSIQFAHDWVNVRVGTDVFPCSGDVAADGKATARGTNGKNTVVTGGNSAPAYETKQTFLFFVPSETKAFDLMVLGQPVAKGTATPGAAAPPAAKKK